MTEPLEREDIQGLVVSSFAHLPCAAYGLFRITDPTRARRWLGSVVRRVTNSTGPQPGHSLNVAITWEGLQALGLPEAGLESFSTAFMDGMHSERRSRVLGDRGSNSPEKWRWGSSSRRVHLLILSYGDSESAARQGIFEVADEEEAIATAAAEVGLEQVTILIAGRQPDSREHFGFQDGVGQPVIAGSGRHDGQVRRTGHATDLPAGEFILGYVGTYGTPTPGPLLSAADDPDRILPELGSSGQRDLGRNGSYLVFRQMDQDVEAFWAFARKAGSGLWPQQGETEAAISLASKMVGRWPSGAPLVEHSDADPHSGTGEVSSSNNFGYGAEDIEGLRCPLGAHIRRTNPRDALDSDPEKARRSANRHRLLRRGRSYGDRIEVPWTVRGEQLDDGIERGLHFICLNGDIERQFEFVQQTWANNSSFGGLSGQTDPLIGDRSDGAAVFSVQEEPIRGRVDGLGDFVTLRGGAYFFLPGLKALRYLASMR